MSHTARRQVRALLLIGLCLAGGPAGLAQRFTSEPVNPAWTRYREALRRGAVQTGARDGHVCGRIPAPVLHLAAERLKPRNVPHLTLPAAFDLRDVPGKVPEVRDQAFAAACWAFGTMASLETCLRPADPFDGSENHLKNTHGFDFGWDEGGNAEMATAYFARWSGPVAEADDPYDPNSGVSPPGLPPRRHVQDVNRLPARTGKTDNDLIKQTVMTYGGVDCSFFYAGANYNPTTHGYYCSAQTDPNHESAIIGWDDSFPAGGFNTPPPGNGAFLLRTSFGLKSGDAGHFWLSYYDASLQDFNCFDLAEPVTNYARQYAYDPLGWTAAFGLGTHTCYYANVFRKGTGPELVRAVGTYATAPNTTYQLSIYRNPSPGAPVGSSAGLAAKLLPVLGSPLRPTRDAPAYTQAGAFTYAGFHTVVLSTPVRLGASDTSFSVVFRVTNRDATELVPVENRQPGYSSAASASPGQSYGSADGETWSDLAADVDPTANCCLKAYTTPAPPEYRPDAMIRNPSPDAYVGLGVVNATGTRQTKSRRVLAGGKAVYPIKVRNSGEDVDDLTIKGPPARAGWVVDYFDALSGGRRRTAEVTGAGWTVPKVARGRAFEFRLEATAKASTRPGAELALLIAARSGKDPTKLDAVKAVTTVVPPPSPPKLSWAGTTGYRTDGVEPNSGPANAQFTFRVKLTDSDGDEPSFVRLALTRNGAAHGTLSLTAVGEALGPTTAGRIYEVKKRLPAGSYGYRFSAKDHDGAATGTPTKAMAGPTVKSVGASAVPVSAVVATRAGGAEVTFGLPAPGMVEAVVLNIAGRPVAALARGRAMPAGTHTLLWSGRSALGPAVPDGVYLIRVEVRGADGGVSRALAAVTIRR